MKLIYLKSALKCDSFDVAIDIKIQFFRVLVTIEPGRSLLFWLLLSRVAPNCLIVVALSEPRAQRIANLGIPFLGGNKERHFIKI